jgi:cysteine synthase A
MDEAGDPLQVLSGLVHGVVSGVGTGGMVVGLHQAFAEAVL